MAARYRAGQVPKFAKDAVVEDDEPAQRNVNVKKEERVVDTPRAGNAVDRRLARLSETTRDDPSDRRSRIAARRRETEAVAEVLAEGVEDDDAADEDMEVDEPEVITETKPPESKTQEEEDLDQRRERLRQKQLEAKKAQESAAGAPQKEEEAEEEEEEESEEEDSEEEFGARPIIAPIFKRKSERDTIAEQQKLEEEEEALERERQKRKEELAAQAKEMLKEEIKRNNEVPAPELMEKEEEEQEEEEIESTPEEYEKWKLREFARIKKEREERDAIEREKAEIARRRELTDAEIEREDKDRLAPREKQKLNFLQKYYHKGAFFRTFDEKDEIQNRWDFNQPTLGDKTDKTILPAVLQVKNFGKQGRTKYTHLTDQDTSKFDSPWFDKKDPSLQKMKKRMAGTGGVTTKKK
eukprot:TRINITY_DN1602_c0_g1_i1.p1 TRINITY_DN1602_c0_g1~~TRINITY_DN1602_c0_g1_i1.p1  ORF type:complete len:411 (+),score=163.04 TRINITY_DN1602_c0_g1_i1:144-1376(+)